MSGQTEQPSVETLAIGTPVEVRNRFNGAWCAGFEVDGTSGVGYWLRRRSDGSLLPRIFLDDDVRSEGRPSSEIDLRSRGTTR